MQVVACSNCGAKNRVDEAKLATSEARCGRCGERLNAAAAGAQDSKPVTITDQTFEREVLQAGGRPVLVDCWAPWCGPCRMVGPIMDQLAAESGGRYRIAKLNVDDNQQTSLRFNIGSIPTMLIFKDGKLIDRLIGAQPKQAIAERLQMALRSAA
ncbi:MAG TPA: thioredoxin [Pyrinomonadaceae bacterium]|jgi:thioredoxin|nr:thioredoxin [Pyrinomonadaceae bacterium]HYV10247.1 thioredoxin [Pyrinomonadaceae bacterium]